MRICQRFALAALVAALSFQSAHAQQIIAAPQPTPDARKGPTATEVLTEAAIIAYIIAASMEAYKSMGKPCACPEDYGPSGRRCGKNSAWWRDGGYKPLCYPADVTPELIDAYRRGKVLPARLK